MDSANTQLGARAFTSAVDTPTLAPHGSTAHRLLGSIGANVRVRCTSAACWWGVATGAAPHLLHVGPLAGTGLVAGAEGRLMFGVIGLLATSPMLWHLHRHTNSWRAPAFALSAFVALFALSTFGLGPILSGGSGAAEAVHQHP